MSFCFANFNSFTTEKTAAVLEGTFLALHCQTEEVRAVDTVCIGIVYFKFKVLVVYFKLTVCI